MNIKEHGPQIRGALFLTFIVVILGLSVHVKPAPEVIMELAYKHEPIQAQDLPIYKPIVVIEEVIRKPKYGFTEKDIYLLTVLLCGSGKKDGDGEYDFDFMQKDNILTSTHTRQQISLVLNVVMNRVNSKQFPNTVSKVVWAKNQFSYMPHWRNGLPKVNPESYAIVKEWCDAYDAYDNSVVTIPTNHLYFSGNGTVNKSRKR